MKLNRKTAALLKASRHLTYLHACEQEGLSSGQPSPEDWYKAVNSVNNAIERFDEVGELLDLVLITKEVEINGRKFTPSNELAKLAMAYNKSLTFNEAKLMVVSRQFNPQFLPQILFAKLEDWGFNVHGLESHKKKEKKKPFNLVIKKARKDKGYTLQELADKIGVNKATIHKWESGKKPLPNVRVVQLRKILFE